MQKVKSTAWLTEERIKIYPRLLTMLYLLGFTIWVAISTGNVDILGRPLGSDFVSFYAAAQLALEGNAHLAYDLIAHYEAEQAIIGARGFGYPSFSYPPTYILLMSPLAYFPYFYAMLIFQLGSLTFLVIMIEKLTNRRESIILCLSFPAVFITIAYGQNALLTAGLLAGAFVYIDRSPILAGFFIGMLSFKPHLGVLIPLILVCSGRWRVFLFAAFTVLIFALISYITFGLESWLAFWEGRDLVKKVLHEELVPYNILQSVFTAMRASGIGILVSYIIHFLVAIIPLYTVYFAWSKKVDLRLQIAVFIIATLMISPYILNYDFTILAVAIAALSSYILEKGGLFRLRNMLLLTWIAPAIIRPLNSIVPLPWATIILLVLLINVFMLIQTETSCHSHSRLIKKK
jgi:alpha-1,2-mannosyltransferase